MANNTYPSKNQCIINSKMASESTTMFFLNQIQPNRTYRNKEQNTFEQYTFLNEILIILTYVIYQVWYSTLSMPQKN